MKPQQVLPVYSYLKHINERDDSSLCNVKTNDIAVLLLCALYHNQVISKKQFLSYAHKYESGELCRFVRSHHSRINKKWYNDMN